jgi:hypothetical protein
VAVGVGDGGGVGVGGGGSGSGKGSGSGSGSGSGGSVGPQSDSRFSRSLTALPVSGDQVLYTDLTLSKYIIDTDSVTLKLYLNGGATFYNVQHDYNYESINPHAKLSVYSRDWTFGSSISYSDSWYNTVHSQIYWTLTPFVEYALSSKWTLSADVALTNATKEYYSVNINPSLTARYEWNSDDGAYITIGQFFANGERAVIGPQPAQGPRQLISGSTFSNYSTVSITLGAEQSLPLKLSVKGWIAVSRTLYTQEFYPQSTFQPEPRTDSQASWKLTLTRPIVNDTLYAFASMSVARNTSLGTRLGSLTQGTIPDYSYERNLYLAGISAYF